MDVNLVFTKVLGSKVWKPERRKGRRGHMKNHPGLLATIGMEQDMGTDR